MATALVIGSNGQDGTFLARHLCARGHQVVGLGLQPQSRHVEHPQLSYRQLDLRAEGALAALLDEVEADFIFHVAAVHASAESNSYEPVFGAMLDVNVKSVHTVLEHLRKRGSGRLLYASSAKVFGSPLPQLIDEHTPQTGRCMYSITKLAAGSLIDHYRQTHGTEAGRLYLFNHESALRPAGFFIPKLVDCLVKRQPTEFFTLQFHCDWGSADEYMDIAIDVIERAPGQDFVLASGHCVHAHSLVQRLCETRGLDMGALIRERDPEHDAGSPYQVKLDKLQAAVGRAPQIHIEALLDELINRSTS